LVHIRTGNDIELGESRGKGVDMVAADVALPLVMAPDGVSTGLRPDAIVVSASDLANGPRDIED
jgi:hypothetical protein